MIELSSGAQIGLQIRRGRARTQFSKRVLTFRVKRGIKYKVRNFIRKYHVFTIMVLFGKIVIIVVPLCVA